MATTTLYFEISVPHFVRFGFYYYAADDVQMKGRSSRTPWEATTKRKWKKRSSIGIKILPPHLDIPNHNGTKFSSTILLSCSCQPSQPFSSCSRTSYYLSSILSSFTIIVIITTITKTRKIIVAPKPFYPIGSTRIVFTRTAAVTNSTKKDALTRSMTTTTTNIAKY